MNTMKAEKWLDKATDKEKFTNHSHIHRENIGEPLRPGFATPHKLPGRTIASNRFMAFNVHESLDVEELAECNFVETADVLLEKMRGADSGGEITRYHLELATKAGYAIAQHQYHPTLKMYLNGSAVCKAIDARAGDVQTEIVDGEAWAEKTTTSKPTRKQQKNPLVKIVPAFTGGFQFSQISRYTHNGPDVELWINPKFLLAALAGLPDLITYRATDSMLYLRGEVDGIMREAVIMGMQKDK